MPQDNMRVNPDDRPPPGVPGGDMNQRGGRIDIRGENSKFEEAMEESFPASDPPALTPAGYACRPPPSRPAGPLQKSV